MKSVAAVIGIGIGIVGGVVATWQPALEPVAAASVQPFAAGGNVVYGRDWTSVQWQLSPEGSARKWMPPATDAIDDPHGGWMQTANCIKNAQ